jgi:hypothetical protein
MMQPQPQQLRVRPRQNSLGNCFPHSEGSQLELGVLQGAPLDPTGNVGALSSNRVSVPEPVSLALLGVGMIGIGLGRRRRSAA